MNKIKEIRERWAKVPEEDRTFRREYEHHRIRIRNRVGYFCSLAVDPRHVGACSSNEALAEFLLHTSTDIAHLLEENDRYREALKEIARSYYQSKPVGEKLLAEIKECEECQWRRGNKYFPCDNCTEHYGQLSAHTDNQKRAEGNHDIALRKIARTALEELPD